MCPAGCGPTRETPQQVTVGCAHNDPERDGLNTVAARKLIFACGLALAVVVAPPVGLMVGTTTAGAHRTLADLPVTCGGSIDPSSSSLNCPPGTAMGSTPGPDQGNASAGTAPSEGQLTLQNSMHGGR